MKGEMAKKNVYQSKSSGKFLIEGIKRTKNDKVCLNLLVLIQEVTSRCG